MYVCCFSLFASVRVYLVVCLFGCLFVCHSKKERITEEVLELHAFILSVLRMLPAAAFFPLFSFSDAFRSASHSLEFYCQTLRWIWICMSFWVKRTDLVESARVCHCVCMRSVNVCGLNERANERATRWMGKQKNEAEQEREWVSEYGCVWRANIYTHLTRRLWSNEACHWYILLCLLYASLLQWCCRLLRLLFGVLKQSHRIRFAIERRCVDMQCVSMLDSLGFFQFFDFFIAVMPLVGFGHSFSASIGWHKNDNMCHIRNVSPFLHMCADIVIVVTCSSLRPAQMLERNTVCDCEMATTNISSCARTALIVWH